MDPGLHDPNRHSRGLGRGSVAQVPVVDQDQYFAVDLRQVVHCFFDRIAYFRFVKRFIGQFVPVGKLSRDGIFFILNIDILQRLIERPSKPPSIHPRLIDHDLQQPCPESASIFKARQVQERL